MGCFPYWRRRIHLYLEPKAARTQGLKDASKDALICSLQEMLQALRLQTQCKQVVCERSTADLDLILLKIQEVHQVMYPTAKPQGNNLWNTQEALARLHALSMRVSQLADQPACSGKDVAAAESCSNVTCDRAVLQSNPGPLPATAPRDGAKEALPARGNGVTGQRSFTIVANSRDEPQTGGAQGHSHPSPSPNPSPPPSPPPPLSKGTAPAMGVPQGPTPASAPDAAEVGTWVGEAFSAASGVGEPMEDALAGGEMEPLPAEGVSTPLPTGGVTTEPNAASANEDAVAAMGAPEGPTPAPTSTPTSFPTQGTAEGPTPAPTPAPTSTPTQGAAEGPTSGPTFTPSAGAGGFSFGAPTFGATSFGAPSFATTSPGTTGFGSASFGATNTTSSSTGGCNKPASGSARSKLRGRKHLGKAAAAATSDAALSPFAAKLGGPMHPSPSSPEAGLFSTQTNQGPDQLDLAWLHTLAGQMASPAFTPPRCEFVVLEGPHTQAVLNLATIQCRALERTSGALMASGMQSLALDLATQALEMSYGWSLGAVQLCRSHCWRAQIFSSMGMPKSAFVEHLRASQANVAGPGCVEVADQLAKWGLFGQMKRFEEQCQAAYGALYEGWRSPLLDGCLRGWNARGVAIEEVLSANIEVYKAGSEGGEALLQQLKGCTLACPGHQPLACRKALLELRLHKFDDALATAQQFVGPKVGQECVPAQWAAHLSAHAYWLLGQLPMACTFLEQAACMQPSFLEQESGVAYTLPPPADMHSTQAQLQEVSQSWVDIVRALGFGDVHSASAIMEQLRQAQRAAACAGMSPGCCAQQLIHEASIHCAWANLADALNIGQQCIKGLTACELAVAMEPSMWWQAVRLQSWLLDRLMAPAAKLSLLQDLQAEKGAQMTVEQVEYFSRGIPTAEAEAYCMTMQMGRSKLSYAILFAVNSNNVSEDKIKSASKALMRVCHSDSAGRAYFISYSQSVPGLGSIYSSGQEADERRGVIRDTLLLVQSAVTDLYPESGVRSSGFEAGPHPDPTPGPAACPVPAATASPDDEFMENSDDLPDYMSD